MAHANDYSTGWTDSSIHLFLKDIHDPPASMKYVLITCLDSCFDVSSIINKESALGVLKPHAKIVGSGVLLPTKKLLEAERKQRIFFGFDEVWFFPASDVPPKPNGICVTGPTVLSTVLPSKLIQWMKRNKCSLALGDGTGLNFVAKLRGIAKYIANQCSSPVGSSDTA